MEGWGLHRNMQKWLAHLLGLVHYIATTHRFGTIQPQSLIFDFFTDPPFELWPLQVFPYKMAVWNFAQRRSLSGPTLCTRSLSVCSSGKWFPRTSKSKVPILGGKSFFFALLRYATGFRLAILELYSTRSIRQKKPQVATTKIKGS